MKNDTMGKIPAICVLWKCLEQNEKKKSSVFSHVQKKKKELLI